ncbi:MAG TPA: zinc ribbon domain-containing protein [Gaiellaceae bacterium]|nr:zinc ribbon domain-containing protein [Gaiellaceae bacterium]
MICLNCGHEMQESARFCARCGAPQTGTPARELTAARTTRIFGSPYVRALRRYWWLLLVGAGVAFIAAVAAVYRIDFGSVPPALEKRAQVSYTSSARLLVTSAEAPYFRTTVPRETEGSPDETGATETTTFMSAPDIGTLINHANLYPVLIESDEVDQIRQEQAGTLPGTVTARAIYAINSPSRFEISQVPVVEVFATSGTYGGAVKLAQATVRAFTTYVDRIQDEAKLEDEQRTVLQEIARPQTAVESGGSSLSLPLMLFVLISAAFAGLALLLDRLFPLGLLSSRRLRAFAGPDGEVATVEPSAEPELETRRSRAKV